MLRFLEQQEPVRRKELKAKHVPALGQDFVSSPAQRFWDVLCIPILAAVATQEWCFPWEHPCPRSYLTFIAISDCRKGRGWILDLILSEQTLGLWSDWNVQLSCLDTVTLPFSSHTHILHWQGPKIGQISDT